MAIACFYTKTLITAENAATLAITIAVPRAVAPIFPMIPIIVEPAEMFAIRPMEIASTVAVSITHPVPLPASKPQTLPILALRPMLLIIGSPINTVRI
jgi:hypothetical protein